VHQDGLEVKALEINLRGVDHYVAGASGATLIEQTLVGTSVAVPVLHVSALIPHTSNSSESLTWVQERIGLNESVSTTFVDSDDFTPPISQSFSDPTRISERLDAIGKEMNGKQIPPTPPTIFDRLYFEVQVNDEKSLDARLLEYEQLQLEIRWHKSYKSARLEAASVSALADGESDWYTWVERELRIGDRVKVTVRDASGT
jgi:hypothetical protein